ncbi:MAG: ribonuclease HII [Gammaproteobacteria bacterium]|nr:ribonuclease HII [Gammaproteobacteria bacterium]OUU06353.1 MAG: ribonuclease HII [Gammaproteobacteria bacterium TMED34]
MYRSEYVAGVDEVGRGPLAGAVFAAAVILNPLSSIEGLRDSKILTVKKRAALDLEIRSKAVAFCVAEASVEEIDRLNILWASMLAMERAVAGLSLQPDSALVDGNRVPSLSCPAQYVIGGDDKITAIAAASIIAKVARDRAMEALDDQYPEYGFARHKGYPTRHHLAVLRRLGPTPIHRMSFAPCRQGDLFAASDEQVVDNQGPEVLPNTATSVDPVAPSVAD